LPQARAMQTTSEIDHKLELGRLFDRDVGNFGPFE
jgi:hypothetical protein